MVAYERAHPGLGAVLVQRMIGETAHRHRFEDRALDAEIEEGRSDRRERRLGQHYALVIGIVAIVSGVVAAGLGHDLTGSLIGAGGVVGLVAVFVHGRAATTARPLVADLARRTDQRADAP